MMNFEEAIAKSKTLKEKPSNAVLLELYGLFKQAKEGDAPEEGSFGAFDFKGKAKHEAWSALKGMDPEKAKEKYVEKVKSLLENENA